jgi:hypothetical protein
MLSTITSVWRPFDHELVLSTLSTRCVARWNVVTLRLRHKLHDGRYLGFLG